MDVSLGGQSGGEKRGVDKQWVEKTTMNRNILIHRRGGTNGAEEGHRERQLWPKTTPGNQTFLFEIIMYIQF